MYISSPVYKLRAIIPSLRHSVHSASMKLSVDVPTLDPDSIFPAHIRDFHRALRGFDAQSENFSLGLLLPQKLHREAETCGKTKIELLQEDREVVKTHL